MPLLEDIERMLEPAQRVSLADWMEDNVVVPTEYKRPGPLQLEDWQREPVDAMLDPDVRILILMWYSQSLKTTSVNCRLAYSILDTQERSLLLAPTKLVLKRFVSGKFDPFLAFLPRLAARIKKNRVRRILLGGRPEDHGRPAPHRVRDLVLGERDEVHLSQPGHL